MCHTYSIFKRVNNSVLPLTRSHLKLLDFILQNLLGKFLRGYGNKEYNFCKCSVLFFLPCKIQLKDPAAYNSSIMISLIQ